MDKIDGATRRIVVGGVVAGTVTCAVLLLWLVGTGCGKETGSPSPLSPTNSQSQTLTRSLSSCLPEILVTGIAVLVAVVPEGLLLAATLAYANAACKAAEKNIFVRDPRAIERMGAVSCVCANITGTLTSGHMHTVALWCGLGDGEEGMEGGAGGGYPCQRVCLGPWGLCVSGRGGGC